MYRSRFRISLVLCLLGLSGCVNLGPTPGDTSPPDVTAPWSDALIDRLPVVDDRLPPLRERITDPQLAALVQSALADNPDLNIFGERIAEARSLARIENAQLAPQLSVGGSVTDQRLSENGLLPAGRIPGFEPDQTLYEANFDASWELDLFGRRANRRERGELAVAEQTARLADAESSLVVEIVRRYVEYHQAAGEAARLHTVIERQRALLDAMKRRRDHGEASDADVELSRVQLIAAQARAPAATRAQRIAHHRLAILTGQAPSALSIATRESEAAPWTVATALYDTQSDVLRRRPDVRLAELHYAQSVLDADLARLDFYPRFTLFASAGPESTARADLTDSASLASAIGGMFAWAVLDGGLRESNREATLSRQAQAALAYRRTVLGALEELENAAVLLNEAESNRNLQFALSEARQDLADMVRRRYEGGTVSVLAVLESERDLAEAQIGLQRAEARRQTEALALEKALGSI